jgi:hypothetical protein
MRFVDLGLVCTVVQAIEQLEISARRRAEDLSADLEAGLAKVQDSSLERSIAQDELLYTTKNQLLQRLEGELSVMKECVRSPHIV